MEKLLYDVDGGTQGCRLGSECPKFVLDEKTQMVGIVDRQGARVNMTIKDFNNIARAFQNGKLKQLRRK
jgi:hypothetical protein